MRISAPTKNDGIGEWEITAIKPDIPITVEMIDAVMTAMCSLPHPLHGHTIQAKRFMRLLVPIITAAEAQAAAMQFDDEGTLIENPSKHWPVDHENGKE